MRVSDVLRIKWNEINNGRLTYQIGKNKKTGSLLLPDKALAILEFYKDSEDEQIGYVFPELEKADQDNPKDIHAKIRTATKKFNNNLKFEEDCNRGRNHEKSVDAHSASFFW